MRDSKIISGPNHISLQSQKLSMLRTQIMSVASKLAAQIADKVAHSTDHFYMSVLNESEKADELIVKAAALAGVTKEEKERLFKSSVTIPFSEYDMRALIQVFEILERWHLESKR